MPRHRRGWGLGGSPHHGERHSPITLSMIEPALLILLKEQPRHGYTLLSELAQMGLRTIHPSVVYRILREMEGLGWIQSDWDSNVTQGPPRRNYELTAYGEEALQNWKNELEKSRDLISKLLDRLLITGRS